MLTNQRFDEQTVYTALDYHTLAVTQHSSAIEKCLQLQRGKAGAEQALDAQVMQEWRRALKAWYDIWLDDGYWRNLEHRAAELGKTDKRLKVSDVQEIRNGLPAAILSINAKLAADDLRSASTIRAAQHLRLGLCSGFPLGTVEAAYSRLFDPIKDNLKDIFADAKERLNKDESQARKIYDELCSRVLPLFDQMSAVDPTNFLSNDTVKDEFSNILRSAAISYTNKTSDSLTGSMMIQTALDVTVSTSNRKRLEEDMKACRNLLTQGFDVPGDYDPSRCWYCGQQPADPNRAKAVPMHKVLGKDVVGWNQIRTTYRDIDLKIPRCTHCSNQHKMTGRAMGLGVLLYFILASVGSAILGGWVIGVAILFPPAWIAAWLLYRAFLYVAVRSYCNANHVKRTKSEGKFKECPLHQAAIRDGYVFGKFVAQQQTR